MLRPSDFLCLLATLPVFFFAPGLGAVASISPIMRSANRIAWLIALLLACTFPFIENGNIEEILRLSPAIVAITVLYLFLVEKHNQQTHIDDSQQDIKAAFTELTNRMDGEDRNLCASLHDELNPCLIFSKRKIEEARQLTAGQEKVGVVLMRAMTEIDRAYALSRSIIKKVRVEIVESIGLIATLEDLMVHYAEISHLSPVLHHNLTRKMEQSMDNAVAVSVYKIVREALLNAVKHSRAKNLHVTLHAQPYQKLLQISVRDDGVGITADTPYGVGLIDMRIRAAQIGGTLVVTQNEQGTGTLIAFNVPLS